MDDTSIQALIGSTQCFIICGCSLVNLLLIVAAMIIAKNKNRSAALWGVLTFFFSLPALLILLLLPSVQPRWPASYPPPAAAYPPYPPSYPPATAYAPPPAPPNPAAFDATIIQTTGSRRLTVIQGPDAGQSFPLGNYTRLGRASDNEIQLSDPQISRYHTFIQQRQDGYWLTDQGSGNGTFVNGQLVGQTTLLSPGDIVTLGNTQLKLS